MLDHVVRRWAISQIPNTWDKWGREDPFHSREKKEWTGVNGSAEVASFPSFLFSLVVFCFTCKGMLCFSGAAVKVVATCFSFYFSLKCTWF